MSSKDTSWFQKRSLSWSSINIIKNKSSLNKNLTKNQVLHLCSDPIPSDGNGKTRTAFSSHRTWTASIKSSMFSHFIPFHFPRLCLLRPCPWLDWNTVSTCVCLWDVYKWPCVCLCEFRRDWGESLSPMERKDSPWPTLTHHWAKWMTCRPPGRTRDPVEHREQPC